MNKYKEAKEWLDKINANPKWNRVDIEESALSQLNELFEKATPKKPKLLNDFCDDFFKCPKCDVLIHYRQRYCDKCGQKFLWE